MLQFTWRTDGGTRKLASDQLSGGNALSVWLRDSSNIVVSKGRKLQAQGKKQNKKTTTTKKPLAARTNNTATE